MYLRIQTGICLLVIMIIGISGCEGWKSDRTISTSSGEFRSQNENSDTYEEKTEDTISRGLLANNEGTDLDADTDAGVYKGTYGEEKASVGETEMEQLSREDIFQALMEKSANQSPSVQFASGSVFDITRIYHEEFEEAVRSEDAFSLLSYFANAYFLFCENPEVVGLSSAMVNTENNDTDPTRWNTDIFHLTDGDMAALCFMPVENEQIEARVFGIILSEKGDGYYYCMVDKDESVSCEVKRNKAMQGIEDIGLVDGRGFKLMGNFLNCITSDFYQK